MTFLNQQPGLRFGDLCEDCHVLAKPIAWFWPCHEVMYGNKQIGRTCLALPHTSVGGPQDMAVWAVGQFFLSVLNHKTGSETGDWDHGLDECIVQCAVHMPRELWGS